MPELVLLGLCVSALVGAVLLLAFLVAALAGYFD